MSKEKPNYIVYSSQHEVIITTPKKEKKIIKLYFIEGKRDLENYDREEIYSDEVWMGVRTLVG